MIWAKGVSILMFQETSEVFVRQMAIRLSFF